MEKRVVMNKPLPDFKALSPRSPTASDSKLKPAGGGLEGKPLPDFSISPRSKEAGSAPRDQPPAPAALPHFRGAASTPITHKPAEHQAAAAKPRPNFAAHPAPRQMAQKHGRNAQEDKPNQTGSSNTSLGMAAPTDRQVGKGRDIPKGVPDFSFQRSPRKKEAKEEARPLPDFAKPFKRGADGPGAPFAKGSAPRQSPLAKAKEEAQAREAAFLRRMDQSDANGTSKSRPTLGGGGSGLDRPGKVDRSFVLQKQAELQKRADEEKEAMRVERAKKRAAAKRQEEELLSRAGIASPKKR